MEIVQLDIEGMTCASCVSHVEKGIKKVPGIEMAAVNLATEKATVSYDPAKTDMEKIIQSIFETGYSASRAEAEASGEEEQKKKREIERLRNNTILAILFSFPLVVAMFAGIFKIDALMFLHNPILQLLLASPVQFWIGRRFYAGAWKSLKAGSPGMDLLVVMGTSAAYLYSIFNGFIAVMLGLESGGLYFEASSIIITLVLLGKYLESNAKGKTSEAIKKLMGLQPKTAKVERDGAIVEVPLSDVVPGDIISVKPGDRFPVDGVVIDGNTTADESTITGESMPVEKKPGDKVVSGTINGYGSITFRAEHVGKDSVLSRIISVVEEAQGSKAPIQKLADRVAAVFVPAVLAIAVITFFIWWIGFGSISSAIISSVAVLVIACPCALGLATPTAIMVGTGIGAQKGILIKNGEILQTAGKITAVVLDKTGTITHGKPEMQEIIPLTRNYNTEELLATAASLENGSEHPLARAVVEAAELKNLSLDKVSDFSAVPGKGICGNIDGSDYYIGTEALLAEKGISAASFTEQKAKLESEGVTVVVLANSSEALALISIADSIKEESREGIEHLKSMGLKVFMITGDNRLTAASIAGQAGVDSVLADVLPEQKAEEVKKLKDSGHIVAMAGDGINDAPALASADIGIAMAEGSDIAMESADITLMRGDLRDIASAVMLSRKTMRKIRQNLFWAFFYNSIGIPFAALGFLNPVIAGAAMAFSSVSVVSNSLSLKRLRIENNKIQNTINTAEENIVTEKIKVEGMTCNHCKMTVEKAALSVGNVASAVVDLDKKELAVTFSADDANTVSSVKEAVRQAGYIPA